MSTGISISSINRIKELAEEKRFKEALEILDTQNLDKSINPQFLKISGEIFRENKRYYDSRRILLKAHQMAPQGTRILHEMIQLYLELGYFEKAEKYYEQYMFYTTPDDTQKDYVEYIMKKATGADVKDLATILIPILERMPEDKWNFEAILLYDKMGRKDMALEESRYILENFKDSVYVQPVIDYIDDKLDVDKWFYVYPKEEKPEDESVYGDLIALEEKILENDYISMYPPEARIMVEADDNDPTAPPPPKEKKPRKRFGKNNKEKEAAALSEDQETSAEAKKQDADATKVDEKSSEDKKPEDTSSNQEMQSDLEKDNNIEEKDNAQEKADAEEIADAKKKADAEDKNTQEETTSFEDSEHSVDATDKQTSEEEQKQHEREEALEKILSKKLDKDKLKESAKQMAKAVKDIDTNKVKNVAETVKGNMKKATDAFGEAVGAKQPVLVSEELSENKQLVDDDEILDGIIESVLEPPKRAVGEVVMNEELDSLIPDSLEAMSEKEIADIESKKEELERLELEALEANLKREEEKKAKKLLKSKKNAEDDEEVLETEEESTKVESTEESSKDTESETEEQEDTVKEEESEEAEDNSSEQKPKQTEKSYTYAELRDKFMEDEEEQPLDSLGFITVVHSDVDDAIEDAMPDAAGMLRQMIDNKESYSGESSLGFESKASYENHGFEVEDFDFDEYRKMSEETTEESSTDEANFEDTFTQETPIEEDFVAEKMEEQSVSDDNIVEEIYTEESVVAFEDVVTEEPVIEEYVAEEPVIEESVTEEPVTEEYVAEEAVAEESVIEETVIEKYVTEEPVIEEYVAEEAVAEESVIEEPVIEEYVAEEPVTEEYVAEEPVTEEPVIEEYVTEELAIQEYDEIFGGFEVEQQSVISIREQMRLDIALNQRMNTILQQLKEGR